MAQWGLQSCVIPFPLHMHLYLQVIIMNLNISKYIYIWQRTVIPWTYWKYHLYLQAYRASVAQIKHASVLLHLSPGHHFSSFDPASVMKTQRETTNLLIFFLTYLLIFFLTYLLTCFLTYLLTFFLTYQRQNIAPTTSHKNRSTNSIFSSYHAAKVISMTALCLSNGNSRVAFDCIGQPRQEAIESKDAKHL